MAVDVAVPDRPEPATSEAADETAEPEIANWFARRNLLAL
jgi:hypothetical protein